MTDITRHSEDAIIGVLLSHPEEYLVISANLNTEHFADSHNKEFFDYFKDCIDRGKTWDESLFLDKFTDMDMDWAKKVMDAGSLAHVNNYISNIRLKHIARKLYSESSKAQEIDVDAIRSIVEDFYNIDNANIAINTKDVFEDVIERLESTAPLVEIPIDLPDLNDHIGGFARKQVYTIAGRPGHSKSMLLTNFLIKPLETGFKVLMADFEMPAFAMIERQISVKCGLPLFWHKRRTQDGRPLDDYRKLVYKSAAETLCKTIADNLTIIKHPTLAEIEANIIKFNPDIVTIDTVQALSNTHQNDGNTTEAAHISRIYKTFERWADKYNCNITVCSQVNKRDDAVLPSMGDLKASGGIEESSSVVLTVRNREIWIKNMELTDEDKAEKVEQNRCQYDIAIRKNRHGEIGEKVVFYNKATGRVSELSVIQSYDEIEKLKIDRPL